MLLPALLELDAALLLALLLALPPALLLELLLELLLLPDNGSNVQKQE